MTHDTSRFSQRRLNALLLGMMLGASLLPAAMAQNKITPQLTPPAASKGEPRLVDSIIAVVNNEVITRSDLVERTRMIERRMTSQGVALPPRADLQRQLLERMIIERAQLQLAKEAGIRVDDVFLDRAMARIAEQNNMTLNEFRNQIERDGTPLPRFREELRDEITMQRLREREVENKIQITDAEVDSLLAAEASAGAAQGMQEVNLAHILVRIPENASPEQLATLRGRAVNALQQIKTGGDFAKIAATMSDAPEALKGGEVGWRNQERLPQLFLDTIRPMKQGEVSDIIKSANGYHILKVLGKRSASAASPAMPAVKQTRARHILIKVNQVVSSADARRKLVEIKQRLDNKAATFEELAKLFSNDLSSSKGGDLGWIYPGDTVPEFERAMDALKPGEVSEPVESPFGMHLIQVVERKTDDVSQERQRLAARQVLRERKLDEATQDWVRQLRDRAYVEYRLEDK